MFDFCFYLTKKISSREFLCYEENKSRTLDPCQELFPTMGIMSGDDSLWGPCFGLGWLRASAAEPLLESLLSKGARAQIVSSEKRPGWEENALGYMAPVFRHSRALAG